MPIATATAAPTAAAPVHFAFDEPFQNKITALMLRDTEFVNRTEGLIKPDYFESTINAEMVDIVLRYQKLYKKVPADLTTFAAFIADLVKSKKLKGANAGAMIVHMRDFIWKLDISDRDFVADKCALFARHQAVSQAILDSVGDLEREDFDSAQKRLNQALAVGLNDEGSKYDYGEELTNRTDERLAAAAGTKRPTGITTGYAEMDRHLYHKGWGRRELSVIMGAAKRGKTAALINFMINAAGCTARYNCLYITLEVASRIIAERSDANIANQIVMELGQNIHDVKDKVTQFVGNAGRMVIHEFPPGAFTVSDLRRLTDKYKRQGLKFDLVVVDYADLMAPERFTDSAIENSKSVYVNLRAYAMQEDVAVLTATQTNRDGAKKTVATMTDVAEDFNKVRIADIVISINQTDEEANIKQARLFFAACRNQRSGFSIRIEQDISRMKFIKKILGTE